MKTLNIKINADSNLDCFKKAVATVACYKRPDIDHRSFFFYTWNFYYDKTPEKSFYESIQAGRRDIFEIINHFFGIYGTRFDSFSQDSLWSTIIQQIDADIPILFSADSFYCPFARYYQIYHGIHTALVTGYDEQRLEIFITDPQYKTINFKIKFNDLFNYISVYWTFSENNDSTRIINYLELVQSAVDELYKEIDGLNMFGRIRKFAQDICTDPEFEQEIREIIKDPPKSILAPISSINKSRKQFTEFLTLFEEKDVMKGLTHVIKEFKKISTQWDVIGGILSKTSLSNNIIKPLLMKVSQKISSLADQEENIAKEISNILEGKAPIKFEDKKEEVGFDITNYSPIYVDISAYCQIKGIQLNHEDKLKARFSEDKYFLLQSKNNGIWESGNHRFLYKPEKESENDNIMCKGHYIEIVKCNYKFLEILGACECGPASENIEFIYDDETIITQPLEFSDWAGNLLFGETIFIEMPVYRQLGESPKKFFDANIYVRTHKLNPDKKLVALKLPYCPNMHIFGLTLYN